MKEQEECAKLLALTDAMIQVQGIVLIEMGVKLLDWNCSDSQSILTELNKINIKVKAEIGENLFKKLYSDILSFN